MKHSGLAVLLVFLFSNELNAQTWAPVGSGTNGTVSSLEVYNNRLYASGTFTTAGGNTNKYIARWDTAWSSVGSGWFWIPTGDFFHTFNGRLYAGLAGSVISWNDTSWSTLPLVFNSSIYEIASYKNTLYIGGAFSHANPTPYKYIARWRNNSWDTVGAGFSNVLNELMVHNGRMYAVGQFSHAGSLPVSRVAVWNDTAWSGIGGGTNHDVYAITVYKGEIYIGGRFTTAGSNSANYIAKWNGSQWVSIGGNLNSYVTELIVYNGELYAAGNFTNPGKYIARYDGTTWKTAGTGLNNYASVMEVYNNELYIGGNFTQAGGITANYIAKWTNVAKPVSGFKASTTSACVDESITFTDTSGKFPTGWKWLFPGGSPDESTAQNPSVYYGTPGQYSVTLIASNVGGKDTLKKTAYINIKPLPPVNITASGSLTICAGDSVTLTADSTDLYLWNTTQTSRSIVVKNAGTYSLTSKSANGCSANSVPVNIKVNPLPPVPQIFHPGSGTFCQGDSIRLTSGFASSYLWSNQKTTRSITVYQSGIYTVKITDFNGCSNTSAPKTITVHPLPDATLTPSGKLDLCQGDTLALQVPASKTYLWSNGMSSREIKVFSQGNYFVEVTDSNGCRNTSKTASVTLRALPLTPLISTPGPPKFCPGDSLELSSSQGNGYKYKWSDSGNTRQIFIHDTGTYTVTVTDTFHCSSTSAPINIKQYPAAKTPLIIPGGPGTICQGDSLLLSTSQYVKYQWSNGGTRQQIQAMTSSSYTVTITDSNGCKASSASFNLTVKALPTTPVITSSNKTLSSSAAAGNQWYLDDTMIPGATAKDYTPLKNGVYSVKVTENGCTSSSLPYTFSELGISVKQSDQVRLYPNPNNGIFTLETGTLRPVNIKIYNSLGELVYIADITDQVSFLQIQAHTPGLYFMILETWEGVFPLSFLIQ